jgi:hypothetical protein
MPDAHQRDGETMSLPRTPVVLAMTAILALGFTSSVSYLLFHTFAEVLYAVVGLGIFLMSWTLRHFLDDDFAVFLGIAFLATSLLHLVHAVDFPGLDMISGGPTAPLQLWVAATLIQAAAFVAAPFTLGRRLPLRSLLVGYLCLVSLVLAGVYLRPVLPATLTEEGLESFKIGAELVASGLLAFAIVLLFRRRDALQGAALPLLVAALATRIAAELSLTLYADPLAWPNMIGHVFLVISIVFIYFAVVQDTLARPHALRVANLELREKAERMARQHEQLLREALEQLVSLTPSFHEEKGEAEIAHAACNAAREVFDADLALLYELQGGTLVVLSACPPEPAAPDASLVTFEAAAEASEAFGGA